MATRQDELALFDTREAAAVWGVTVRTAERWAKSGRAKPTKEIRGCYVFTGQEVNRVARLSKPRPGPAPGFRRHRRSAAGARPLPFPGELAGDALEAVG